MPELVEHRQALEELRTADRILAGLLSTLRGVGQGNNSIAIGLDVRNRGPFSSRHSNREADQADLGAAMLTMVEAKQAFRTAVRLIASAEGGPAQLERWGHDEASIDGISETFTLGSSAANVEAVSQVQDRVRHLFERVASSDARLADVPALFEWGRDEQLSPLQSLWQFNKPALFASAIFALVFAALFLSARLGGFE